MKFLFKSNTKIYEIDFLKEEVKIKNEEDGESLSMNTGDFRKFIKFMNVELEEKSSKRTEIQKIDVYDIK